MLPNTLACFGSLTDTLLPAGPCPWNSWVNLVSLAAKSLASSICPPSFSFSSEDAGRPGFLSCCTNFFLSTLKRGDGSSAAKKTIATALPSIVATNEKLEQFFCYRAHGLKNHDFFSVIQCPCFHPPGCPFPSWARPPPPPPPWPASSGPRPCPPATPFPPRPCGRSPWPSRRRRRRRSRRRHRRNQASGRKERLWSKKGRVLKKIFTMVG